ncbi:MAG: PKD domain-containing protein [Cyclobacterium sp.]|uniref:PKD domain-containing protein n=1 Tax=unclassified Cyclobacterium TaxID=2615055 RepID=UPI0013D06A02|nr:PKD domain-containing protein [Cyclobacterium sp. SYSU L10401]
MRKIEFILLSAILVACCESGFAQTTLLNDEWGFTPTDSLFAQPYVDIDEWRDTPLKHRYVHGGFKGTDTRFSFYFPQEENYERRFFQYITPIPDNENLSQGATGEEDKISFSIQNGAYFIETNGGGNPGIGADRLYNPYKANAASAAFSRTVARQIYPADQRPFGYAFGGSGGAYRTIGGFENTDTWDGAVPYVAGSPMAIPNVFTVRMHAMRVLQDMLPQIADAVEAGGGDMYAGLNPLEKAALMEVTKMGFPKQAWFNYDKMGIHAFPAIFKGIKMADAPYFTDFWTVPGYLGKDNYETIEKDRLQQQARIKKIITKREAYELGLTIGNGPGRARGTADAAWQNLDRKTDTIPVAFQLDSRLPEVQFLGGELKILSGETKGKALALKSIDNDLVVVDAIDPKIAASLQVGNEVQVDNSDYLAAQTYHRHQVPGPEYEVWDQFRDENGNPVYPQRPMLMGPLFTKSTVGSLPNGDFRGKMILLGSLWDTEAYPWQSDWYRKQAKESLGDAFEDNFRLWFTDHANHGDLAVPGDPTHIVSYLGVLQQALLDLSNWVEKGIAPAAATNYKIIDGQVIVPDEANERMGIQPVIHLNVNGSQRAAVSVGENVTLSAQIEVPENQGSLVDVSWDMDGSGDFLAKENLRDTDQHKMTLTRTHSFSEPGTYFITLKAISQRNGDTKTPFTRIPNLDRVRVVVK